jgi:Asp-tRNA(Asn)/Glu-tRNA(Gln) amidotransferase A subunit family amidase
VREAFGELTEALGEAASDVDLGESFGSAPDMQRVIMEVEMAHNFRRDYDKFGNQLSDKLRGLIERGRKYPAAEYMAALSGREQLNNALDGVFDEYDAILTPAALGPAPAIESTGSPIFCSTWSLLGTPAISLPLLTSEAGLPIGVQLVGRRGNDARLLRTARSLVNTLQDKGSS